MSGLQGVTEYNKMVVDHTKAVNQKVHKAFKKSAIDWEREARRRVPTNTGTLKRRIRNFVTIRGAKTAAGLKIRDPRAWWLEFGTGLYGPRRSKYPITAKRAPFLVFRVAKSMTITGQGTATAGQSQTGWKRMRKVMHPGIKVGTPRNPRRGWMQSTGRKTGIAFKRAPAGQSMPYVRPAFLKIKRKVIKRLEVANRG